MVAVKPPQHRPPSPTQYRLLNLLAACVAAGLGTLIVQDWIDRFGYAQAESLYRSAQCESALPAFQRLIARRRIVDLNDYAARAAARQGECEAFMAATTTAPDASAQLLSYDSFIQRYPNGPLASQVRQASATLTTTIDTANLATMAVCDRLESLRSFRLIADQTAPGLMLACGQTYTQANRFELAIPLFHRVMEDYNDPNLLSQAETALAQALTDQAQQDGAGALPEPGFSGYTSDGTTVVEIRNDSPEAMRIVFSGPEPRFEELPPAPNAKPLSVKRQRPVLTSALWRRLPCPLATMACWCALLAILASPRLPDSGQWPRAHCTTVAFTWCNSPKDPGSRQSDPSSVSSGNFDEFTSFQSTRNQAFTLVQRQR